MQPVLRFPEFNGEWEEKTFEEFTKTNQGLQIAISNRETQYKDGYYFYITNEFLKPNSKVKYYIKNPPDSVIARKNDILMTRTGNTGKVITGVYGAFHNNFFKINFDNNKYDRLFLYELLKSPKINNKILSLAGTSTIPDLNHSDFYSIKSFIPQHNEQQKIGDFFSKLDQQIELEEKKLELLEQQKRGYMQKLFSQELRFKDENGYGFPNWRYNYLENYIISYNEKTTENNQYPVLTSSREGLFLQKDYFTRDVASKDNTGYNVVPYGYFTYRHMSDDLIFKFNINYIVQKGIVSTLYPVFKTTNDLDNYFLKEVLNNGNEFKKYALMQKQGGSRTYMYFNKLKKLKLHIPVLEEQQKIGDFLVKLDKLIENQSKKIDFLKQRKQGLLQKMFI